MKRSIILLLILAILMSLAGCGGKKTTEPSANLPEPDVDAPVVGICLPQDSRQWQEEAEMLEEQLHKLGFQAEIQYAQADPVNQAQQIKAFVAEQVAALVIAPVDAMALTQELTKDDLRGIPAVGYDWPGADFGFADLAVCFAYFPMGQALGEYIETTKNLSASEEGYTVEFIMGSAEDDRAVELHTGLMRVLQPYLDAQVLECPSGRTSFADTYTLQENPETVKQRLSKTLEEQYQNKKLDILCVASDEMAAACAEVLIDAGYTQEDWPLITGQGGTPEAIRQIIAGKQTVTVYKDRPGLAELCAQMTDQLVNGTYYEHESATGGADITIHTVDVSNYEELLVKTGIYKEKDLK